MSDTEDLYADTSRDVSGFDTNLSTESFTGDGDSGLESQNLLMVTGHGGRDLVRGNGGTDHLANESQTQAHEVDPVLILNTLKGMKRSMEAMASDVKRIKDQNVVLDKKLNTVLNKNENMEKHIKKLESKNNKVLKCFLRFFLFFYTTNIAQELDSLDNLLSVEGLKVLKQLSMRNLDCKAEDRREQEIMTNFMVKAKDVRNNLFLFSYIFLFVQGGWLCKNTGKADKDIGQQFRRKNSYLRAQIRQRVMEDISNKTPEEASDLPKSEKFIREHLGVGELNNECLLILYNYAFTHLKYLNKKVTLNELEKKSSKSAQSDPWIYTMARVTVDKQKQRDFTYIKTRFCDLLISGADFQPR